MSGMVEMLVLPKHSPLFFNDNKTLSFRRAHDHPELKHLFQFLQKIDVSAGLSCGH